MDVKTGKTTGVAYVEAKFPHNTSKEEIAYIVSTFKLLFTQSRRVLFELSSYDQLCNELFPSWKGSFKDGKAIPYSNPKDQDADSKAPTFFMDQRDLQSLLNICRHYKVIHWLKNNYFRFYFSFIYILRRFIIIADVLKDPLSI